jgi:hypothetical protein
VITVPQITGIGSGTDRNRVLACLPRFYDGLIVNACSPAREMRHSRSARIERGEFSPLDAIAGKRPEVKQLPRTLTSGPGYLVAPVIVPWDGIGLVGTLVSSRVPARPDSPRIGVPSPVRFQPGIRGATGRSFEWSGRS